MGTHHLREGLRYATTVSGALYVMICGGMLMPMLLVDNLDFLEQVSTKG